MTSWPAARFADLADEIRRRPPRLGPVRLVVVDGPAGAGKSTFATRLWPALGRDTTAIVHTDDLVDGWADQFTFWNTLESGLLAPFRQGQRGSYPIYSWSAGRFTTTRHLDPPEVLILEGSTSARPPVLDEVTFSVFLDAPEPVRLARALRRDGSAIEEPLRRWMRAENAHFAAQATRTRVDLVVDGAPSTSHDLAAEYVPLRTQAGTLILPERSIMGRAAPPDFPDPTATGVAGDGRKGERGQAMSDETAPVRRRVTLTGISSRAWEHPADRGALTALRELRGFDEVLKALASIWNERAWRLQYLGGSIRADHRQHPRVHRVFAEAAATLDIPELPELYVEFSPMINASCVGMARPFIVVTSRSVELFDDEELRYVLGHELGHLVSGHAVYRTMMAILTRLATNIAWIPLGTIAIRVIIAGLYEWWRKAELSADRAGLLAGQDPAAALRAHMKLAGGGDLSEIDTAAFLDQAAEYDRGGDLRDSLIKLRMVMGMTHPLPVARASELRAWIDSGAYQRILAGDYPRRENDSEASVTGDIKEAAEEYRRAFARSEDPLAGLVRRVGDGANGVGDWVGSGAGWVRDWWRRSPRDNEAGTGDGPSSPDAANWSSATDEPTPPTSPDDTP